MSIAPLAPPQSSPRRRKLSTPFAQFVREKPMSYPSFVREIELFAHKEAEQVALKEPRHVRLEEKIGELLVELPDAVIAFHLPPFSSRNNQPCPAYILRPSLPTFARRLQTVYGAVSILPSSFTFPPSSLIRIAGVTGICADLRDYRSALGTSAFALSQRGARPVLLATKDLVLRPVVTVLDHGGYRVGFEFAAGAFHGVEDDEQAEFEVKAKCAVPLGRAF